MDAVITMLPDFCRFMCGTAKRIAIRVEVMLMSMARW